MPEDPPTPESFQGLRPDLPVEVYRRNLPHWRQENATYFVTFRLNDSLPVSVVRELRSIKEEWKIDHPEPRSSEEIEKLAKLLTQKQEIGWIKDTGAASFDHLTTRKSWATPCAISTTRRYEAGRMRVMKSMHSS